MTSTAAISPASSEEGKPVDRRKLRKVLIDLFTESEMRDLYFELNVNYDAEGGQGTAEKARQLVLHFQNRRRLNVLANVVIELRSQLTWDDIASDKVEEVFPSTGSDDTFIAGQGITALIKVMSVPEVRTATVAFQTDFVAASEQIDLMNDYKLIHDLFQELENRYALIVNDQKRLPADEMAWDNIDINEPELQGKIRDLINVVNQAAFAAEEARWVQQLDKSKDNIRHAVENFDLEELKSGTQLLYRILNRQPSRINAQLVATVRALRLDALEKAMTTISQNLTQSNLNLEATNEIQKGIEALAGLDDRVNNLVLEHNAWQEIDDELRRVEASLPHGIEELEDAWIDLEPMASDLFTGKEDNWATGLQEVTNSLGQALEEQAIVTVRRLFRRFRSQTSRRFRQVDFELLSLAQDLQRVGESLDILLRKFK